MPPDGLRYVDSWVDAGFGRCFQPMDCDDLALLMAWIAEWTDLVDFEVVPVVPSAQAAAELLFAALRPATPTAFKDGS